MGKLDGKVCVVTGGAGGFGKGIAQKMIEEGAHVIIADFIEEAGTKTAGELGCEFIKADITSREAWDAVVKFAVDKFGRLDSVVNNAGTTYRNKPSLDVTEDEFDKVFTVNVKSIYLSSLAVVPQMKKNGGGTIINIASTAGIRPRPGLTWYNASKAAVINATKALAVEFAPDNIRCNSICPVVGIGTGLTDFFLGRPENEKVFLATVPLGRGSTPRDIGNVASFLSSDEGNFLTGIDVPVDGGRCV